MQIEQIFMTNQDNSSSTQNELAVLPDATMENLATDRIKETTKTISEYLNRITKILSQLNQNELEFLGLKINVLSTLGSNLAKVDKNILPQMAEFRKGISPNSLERLTQYFIGEKNENEIRQAFLTQYKTTSELIADLKNDGQQILIATKRLNQLSLEVENYAVKLKTEFVADHNINENIKLAETRLHIYKTEISAILKPLLDEINNLKSVMEQLQKVGELIYKNRLLKHATENHNKVMSQPEVKQAFELLAKQGISWVANLDVSKIIHDFDVEDDQQYPGQQITDYYLDKMQNLPTYQLPADVEIRDVVNDAYRCITQLVRFNYIYDLNEDIRPDEFYQRIMQKYPHYQGYYSNFYLEDYFYPTVKIVQQSLDEFDKREYTESRGPGVFEVGFFGRYSTKPDFNSNAKSSGYERHQYESALEYEKISTKIVAPILEMNWSETGVIGNGFITAKERDALSEMLPNHFTKKGIAKMVEAISNSETQELWQEKLGL